MVGYNNLNIEFVSIFRNEHRVSQFFSETFSSYQYYVPLAEKV